MITPHPESKPSTVMDNDDTELDWLAESGASEEQQHPRVIIHIDVDCFYAQVETLKNPSLEGKAVGVQQKDIVVTCNYEARRRGVGKLASVKAARQVCPDLVLVNGEDLGDYRIFSERIHAVLQTFSPLVEKLGLDENFVDVTDSVAEAHDEADEADGDDRPLVGHVYGPVQGSCGCGCRARLVAGSALASEMRHRLKEELGIRCSAGIGHNKLLAKLAGSLHKPDQQTAVMPWSALRLVGSLDSARRLPGVGSATAKKLETIGVRTVADLQRADPNGAMARLLGAKLAHQVHRWSCGRDDGAVKASAAPKSIGAEDGFAGVTTPAQVDARLRRLLGRVWALVRRDGRLPASLKLTARKRNGPDDKNSVRETRQTGLDSTLFPGWRTAQPLSDSQIDKLVQLMMGLFQKMVADGPFLVTLVGISFSGFAAVAAPHQNNSIDKYFGTKSDDGPAAKRARLDAATCPAGYDASVWAELPAEIRDELLAEDAAARPTPTPAPAKPRDLRHFFRPTGAPPRR